MTAIKTTTQHSSFSSIQLRRPIERRAFLKGVGVGMALPFLEAMVPPMARAAPALERRPMRMLCVCNNLSILPEYFVPTDHGPDYTPSHYLGFLQEHRRDFTVFSGVSHPSVSGGHSAQPSFLTAAPGPNTPSFRNTVSLDQLVADELGARTRFPSLVLGVNVKGGGISFTRSGVQIPAEEKPSLVFRTLFLQGSPTEMNEQLRQLDQGHSILDTLMGQARRMEAEIGREDRERLDQYFSSVRDLEKRFEASREWTLKPKPLVQQKPPKDVESTADFLNKNRLMYDLARLAFETDSTRVVTLLLDAVATPPVNLDGKYLTDSYHNLSHHGQSPDKIAQLKVLDEGQMKLLAQLFSDLKSVKEGEGNLLDHTMVYYGSNMGNASKHSSDNLPALLAGGGFKHGQHLAFDKRNNYPLPNLYVSMLQRMGIAKDRFATSTGTMKGLEVVA